MKIQVGGLSEGVHRYRFEVQGSEVDLGDTFPGLIVVEAALEKSGTQLALRAAIESSGSFLCDRCLTPLEKAIRGDYRMFYLQEGSPTEGFDPVELQVIPASTTAIDLTEDVRQTLLLSFPLKNLCREECRGLCPRCGTNWNEQACTCSDDVNDGRWDALRSLKKN